ncbi:MAG: right-handed parallel beta-helix repeat-containing protein, partial [Kineosporiaceae bacterium]
MTGVRSSLVRLLWGVPLVAALAVGTAPPGGEVGLAGTVPVAADIVTSPGQCPGVRTVDGGFVLTENTTCNVVWRDDATVFDLRGHMFKGELRIEGTDQTLRNGTLITERGLWNRSADLRVSHLRVQPPTPGGGGSFLVEAGHRTLVEYSTFLGAGKTALSFYFGDGGTVRRSTFRDNGRGVSVQRGDGVVITENQFIGNDVGINLWDEDFAGVNRVRVNRNRITGSRMAGISLRMRYHDRRPPEYRPFQDGRIEDNLVSGSGAAGLDVTMQCVTKDPAECGDYSSVQVNRNTFRTNGSAPTDQAPWSNDGVTARSAYLTYDGKTSPLPEGLAFLRLRGNVAVHNAGHGFDVVGVTDGGRNVARGNGDPEQCLGLSCAGVRRSGGTVAPDGPSSGSVAAQQDPV